MTDEQPKSEAADRAMPVLDETVAAIYRELRLIARRRRAGERNDLTLQTTTLVHEAWIRLVGSSGDSMPSDDQHLKAMISRIIRHVLVDYGRRTAAAKRNPAQAPPGMIELAYTDACCHAFRHPRAPFWATQFHPEVDRATLVERLRVYATRYTRDTAHYDQVIAGISDTPESNALIGTFVERVLGSKFWVLSSEFWVRRSGFSVRAAFPHMVRGQQTPNLRWFNFFAPEICMKAQTFNEPGTQNLEPRTWNPELSPGLRPDSRCAEGGAGT
jgi:DNA-directed RNA polymerase specialized sigma24 family protein